MSEWAAKRFYETVTVEDEGGGFAVRLDARPIRTPGKRAIVMPSPTMARQVAAEWEAQTDQIDPATMPWMRSVNSAIDKVEPQRQGVIDHLIAYAGSDLLCYRAADPKPLAERQASAWDPVLAWMTQRYDVQFITVTGVMPVEQPADLMPRLVHTMEPMSAFQLTGFHDLVGLSGSFALALAAVKDVQPPEKIWKMSRIDEDWQIEQWGDDEEAAKAVEVKRQDFLHAFAFYKMA